MKWSTIAVLSLFLTPGAFSAAEPPKPRTSYALHLEARPTAAFPFLDKLGRVEVQVYPQGVRADSLWLDGYMRTGSDSVRLENPSVRLYSDSSFASLSKIFASLKPRDKQAPKLRKLQVVDTGRKGTIKKLPVRCYTIKIGKRIAVDVWSTTALARNTAWEKLQNEVLKAVSPELAQAAKRIPGTTMHVVLREKGEADATLLTTREVFLSSAGHEEALSTGRLFLRAPDIGKLMR